MITATRLLWLAIFVTAGCDVEAADDPAAADMSTRDLPATDLPATDLAAAVDLGGPCPPFSLAGNLFTGNDATLDGAPAGWTAQGGLEAVVSACKGGSVRACLPVVGDGGSSADLSIHIDRFFTPMVGKKYHGEVWVKLDRVDDSATLAVQFMLPGNAFLNAGGTTTAAATGWQRLTVDFTVVALPDGGDYYPVMALYFDRSSGVDFQSCVEIDQAYFGETS